MGICTKNHVDMVFFLTALKQVNVPDGTKLVIQRCLKTSKHMVLKHLQAWLKLEVGAPSHDSMDWFMGKITGNRGFYHEIWGFPVKCPF